MKKPAHGKGSGKTKKILMVLIVLVVILAACFATLVLKSNGGNDESIQGEEALTAEVSVELEGVVISSEDEFLVESEAPCSFLFDGSEYEDVYVFFIEGDSSSKIKEHEGSSVLLKGTVSSVKAEKPYLAVESVTPSNYLIDMKYGSFVLPYKWREIVAVDEKEVDGGILYVFKGSFGGKDSELFSIGYGVEGDDVVAAIEVDSEKIDVTVSIPEAPKSLKDESLAEYYAAQDDINYLLENTKYNDGVLVYSI